MSSGAPRCPSCGGADLRVAVAVTLYPCLARDAAGALRLGAPHAVRMRRARRALAERPVDGDDPVACDGSGCAWSGTVSALAFT